MKKWAVMMIFSLFVLTSCAESKIKTTDLFQKGLDAKKEQHSYYMEVATNIEERKKSESYKMKVWYEKDTHKRRVEVYNQNKKESISVFDGETTYMYDIPNKEVYTLTGINYTPNSDSFFVENSTSMLTQLQKTHTIQLKNEEKIAGRKTYKINAIPKKEGTLFQNQKIWIDQKTWLPLKMEVEMGDSKIEYEVKTIDYSPSLQETLFKLKTPKDVAYIELDDTFSAKEMTLDEVKKELGHSFLYLPSDEKYIIEKSEMYFDTGDEGYKEFTISYFMNDSPYFTLTFFREREISSEDEFDLGLKQVKVRGYDGEIIDDQIRNVSWVESGIRYSIDLEENELTFDEMIKLSERFVLYE